MSIISEIKKNKSSVFRRIYMKRRQDGGEYESEWQQVPSEFIMKYGTITYSVDDVLPNFYKFSGLTFEVSNNTGYFSDTSDDKSFFFGYLTRYNTLVKLEAGYKDESGNEFPTNPTLFVGLIGDDIPYTQNNVVQFRTNHISSIFDDLPADNIHGLGSSLTASEIIEKVRDFQDSNGVNIFQKYISLTAWNINTTTTYYDMATTTSLQNKTCWKLMQELAEAEQYVLYVDRDGSFYFKPSSDVSTASAFHFSGLGDTDRTYGHNIMEQISVDDNIRKVYNRVRVQHTKDDTTTSFYIKQESWNWGDSSSSFLWGVREYKYKNTFLDSSTAITVGDAIYTEFKNPKQEIKLKSKFVPQLMVQDLVDVTYKTRRYAVDGSLWGLFLWGYGVWGERLGYNIFLDGTESRLTNLSHNIDQFYSMVTLREL